MKLQNTHEAPAVVVFCMESFPEEHMKYLRAVFLKKHIWTRANIQEVTYYEARCILYFPPYEGPT